MKQIWIIGSIFLFLFLFSSPLKAVTDEEKEAVKKLNEEILFQQEQEKRAEESKLPPVILDSSVDQLKKVFNDVQQDLIAPKKQGKCFQIFVIKLNGNSLFSQKKLEKIYPKYLFRCIFKKDIDELIAELHLLYHDRGYSLARIFVNEESNFLIGDLIIEILEGRIQKITIENKNKTQKIKNPRVKPPIRFRVATANFLEALLPKYHLQKKSALKTFLFLSFLELPLPKKN